MSDLRQDAGDLVDSQFSSETIEPNDDPSNRAKSENPADHHKTPKATEPNEPRGDLIRQRLADKPDVDAIDRLSGNQSDNQTDNMTERSGDRSDRLSDRFDFELNSDNQSNSSILDDFNHLKLTESTDKSFGRHENFYSNESAKDTNDAFDQSDRQRLEAPNRSVNPNWGGLSSQLSERSDNQLDEQQSDNQSEQSDDHHRHIQHRPSDQLGLAASLAANRSVDQLSVSSSSDAYDKTGQAGLNAENLAGPTVSVVNRDALGHEHRPAFGHSRSGSSSSTQDKELVEKLRTELSRLKQHLIQIEEDYTNELVEVQQREQSLEQQLIKANAEVEQLTHRLNNTGPLVAIRAQAEQALDERDQVLQRCSKLEDEVQRSQASLANLQLVIERMQKEHDQRLQTANKLHEQAVLEERCRYSALENEINKYQLKLKESNAALQAASRLSQQLHAKQETIDQLRNHLQKKEELVNRLHDEINQLNSSAEGKVDKQFIKNLVVGYFKADSDDKKQDVARLLARILDFNELEMRRAGIQLNTSGSYDPHGHRRQGSASSTASSSFGQEMNESIAQQFVHFLEEESKVHKVPVAKKLAADLSKAVSPPAEPIKATNLISMPAIVPATFPSSTSTFTATSIAATTLGSSVDPDVSQPEVRPMLIPNSAIMNAQLSKLSLNNGSKASSKAPIGSTNSSSSQAPSTTGNQAAMGDTVKPVVLTAMKPVVNLPNNYNSFHSD